MIRFPQVAGFSSLVILMLLGNMARATIVSHFPADDGGWSASGDNAGPVSWVGSGGNPAGHIEIDDAVLNGITYFVAPPRFRGVQSDTYGFALNYDLRQSYPGASDPFNAPDVILEGAGLTLVLNAGPNPANNVWTTYSVALTEDAGWKLSTLGGSPPSRSQMEAVLADLTGLRIRAEFQNGSDTGSLDNVELVPEPTSGVLMAAGLAGLALHRRRRR